MVSFKFNAFLQTIAEVSQKNLKHCAQTFSNSLWVAFFNSGMVRDLPGYALEFMYLVRKIRS